MTEVVSPASPIQDTTEESFRARSLPVAFYASISAMLVFALLNGLVRDPAWMVDLAGAALLATLWAARRRLGHDALALALCTTALVVVGVATWASAPILENYLWFFPIPPFAALLSGRRLGIVMFVLSTALIIAFELAAHSGYYPYPKPASAWWFQLAILLGVFTITLLFALYYDHSRDVSQRRLSEARQRAEAADQAKSRFLACMTHELRTPMHGILGMTEELLRLESDTKKRELLETVQSSGLSMLRLIDDLLDHSKIQEGRMRLEILAFQPRRMLDEVLGLLRTQASDKGLRLVGSVDADVPPALSGDPFRLRQVLLNLVGNALKFTERGEVRVRVAVAPDGQYVLEVRDTGIGIDPAVLPHLFQSFTQADASTSRRYGGSGLGLAISRGLVTAMGGTLHVESTPGQGSRFWITLPLARAELEPTARTDVDDALRAERRKRTILIADDDGVNRRIATLFLERSGYQCRVVPDGRAAVETVREGAVDAVLIDCHMPLLDGPGAARAIRQLDSPKSRIPIIALTATAEEEGALCLASGMDAVVSKPTTMVELVAVVDRWTSLARTPPPL